MSSFFPTVSFFFFNDTATTEIYTLSLHDALPISGPPARSARPAARRFPTASCGTRSEEHTSELQSRLHLVCRLLLEKKKKKKNKLTNINRYHLNLLHISTRHTHHILSLTTDHAIS